MLDNNHPHPVSELLASVDAAPRRRFESNWYTKSEYARKIKKSPTHVNNLITAGELEVIEYNGGELVVAPASETPA